jgi:hypothetical protein
MSGDVPLEWAADRARTGKPSQGVAAAEGLNWRVSVSKIVGRAVVVRWAPRYGMLTDCYGVTWNRPPARPASAPPHDHRARHALFSPGPQ